MDLLSGKTKQKEHKMRTKRDKQGSRSRIEIDLENASVGASSTEILLVLESHTLVFTLSHERTALARTKISREGELTERRR